MSGKKVKIVSGNSYWDFEENPLFIGKYIGEATNEDGKLIGYTFDDLDGEQYLISNSYAIEKALNTEINGIMVRDQDKPLEIEFRGKAVMKKNGQSFNKFDVSLLDTDPSEEKDIVRPKKKAKSVHTPQGEDTPEGDKPY